MRFGVRCRRFEMLYVIDVKPRRQAPSGDLVVRESQTAMRELGAHLLNVMRCEIGDQQAAARAQRPRGLFDGASRVIQKVQHVMNGHQLEASGGNGEAADVVLSYPAVRKVPRLEPRPGDREHLATEIHTEPTTYTMTEDLQDAAGAGAEVQKGLDRLITGRLEHRRLNATLVDVLGPYRVPTSRVFLEVERRGRIALASYRVEVRLVAGEDRRIEGKHVDEGTGGGRSVGPIGDAKERLRPFRHSVQKSGIAENFQVPRDPRLALTQDRRKVANGELGDRDQGKDPEPGVFPNRAQSFQ